MSNQLTKPGDYAFYAVQTRFGRDWVDVPHSLIPRQDPSAVLADVHRAFSPLGEVYEAIGTPGFPDTTEGEELAVALQSILSHTLPGSVFRVVRIELHVVATEITNTEREIHA